MLQNAPDCTIKKMFGEACPRTPGIANAWLRHALQAPPPHKKKIVELLLRNLFETPPWQTIDCV